MKYKDFNLQETLGMTEPLKVGRVTYHLVIIKFLSPYLPSFNFACVQQ